MRRLFKFLNKMPGTPLCSRNLNKDFLGAQTYFIFMKADACKFN